MGEMINLTASCGHKFQAYAAGDTASQRGIVIVQEIFGVNSHMRQISDHLASFGYRVVTPALFDRVERGVELGYDAAGRDKGLALRAEITDEAVMRDIEASAAALSPRPTGIIGYCWGGTIAWWGATRSKSFKAAIGWYGGGIAATRSEKPNCPVQLHFGAEDKGIPLADVESIRKAQPDVGIFVYPGAEHGFGCHDRPSFNPRANEIAEHRSLAFFAEHVV
ncbi:MULTISPECIES: dienelactone hydrolase family protein [Acidiphilium]|uniref:Carboxymethylenebutenolidase n=2 Tax=Acidiphilium TaxID=522 RepID=A5FWY7_ACICJ|nr:MULTISPECIES: dienelactone hydrolase family protein [Acidiphilium]ABQ30119.1 Carboxymethylenebutenolidase [Acidiphilium cryptum JF-5]KDM67674.1 putative carboxymethylenebutenolidase [Acidiphilium sp. JA12-A1]UNC15767.1 dienelactone hydrolase family protein [Acidiphilium multivorum]